MFSWQVRASTGRERAAKVGPRIKSMFATKTALTFLQERAADAPIIRQLFSSSPKDPRYHMLSYISHKFQQENKPQTHEPRAALFLNRFTRTLTIVYATNGLADLLGISADELCGKSFYYCIQENCLNDAVKCLESAKANDSIAYLRFWFRDPRQGDQNEDEHMDGNSSGEDEDGGVPLDDRTEDALSEHAVTSDSSVSQAGSSMDHNFAGQSSAEPDPHHLLPHAGVDPASRSSSGNSSDLYSGANGAIFDQPATRQSSTSSVDISPSDERQHHPVRSRSSGPPQVELEAVVSCTSDGLVVVLRRARALVPQITQPTGAPVRLSYENGYFASPWAADTLLENTDHRRYDQPDYYQPGLAPIRPTVAQADTAAMKGPDQEDFMNSIREVAVFAWSLTGINGSLARYGRGKPMGESLPPNGLPIWRPDFHKLAEQDRHPDHGNSPQATRQHGLRSRPSGTLSNGHGIPPTGDHSNSFDGYSNGQPSSTYGSGNGNTFRNEKGDNYTNGCQQTPHDFPSNGAQGFLQNSYSNGLPNGYHMASFEGSRGDSSGGPSSYGNYSSWGEGNREYSSAKTDQQQHGQDVTMDTRDTNSYFNYDSNIYGLGTRNEATLGNGPQLSQSQQLQHWDGLMPDPTSNHEHTHRRSPSGFQ